MTVRHLVLDSTTPQDKDDPRFHVVPVDTEIAPFATEQVLDHPICIQRVARSKANPSRFFMTTLCYDDAMDFAEGVVRHHQRHNKSSKHWRIVHGILQDDEGRWGHAWVEQGSTVYDSRLLAGERVYAIYERVAYYSVWRPCYTRMYSLPEAKAEMHSSALKNAGPWDSTILMASNHARLDHV
jgi:hypothetical protein